LIGIVAVIEQLLYELGFPFCEYRVADVRNHFIGTNQLRREAAKARVIERCRVLGLEPVDDNAADALALLSFAQHRARLTDMLSRTA
jgi:Holliday junction resolvasome RuvABC endonuclease subunit